MKGKIVAVLLSAVLMLSLASCGNSSGGDAPAKTESKETAFSSEVDESPGGSAFSSLEEIIETIKADEQATLKARKDDATNGEQAISSYELYLKNKGAIDNWYSITESETDALYQRIIDDTIAYYKMMAKTMDLSDTEAVTVAMNNLYETLKSTIQDCSNGLGESYQIILNAVGKSMQDSKDFVDYDELCEEAATFDEKHAASAERCSQSIKAAVAVMESNHSEMITAFTNQEKDIDAVLARAAENREKEAAEAEQSEKEEAKQETSEKKENMKNKKKKKNTKKKSSKAANGVTPEFKEAMDSYEEFFDEYVKFLDTYSKSDNPVALLSEYTQYMTKYAEVMSEMEAVKEEELSDADSLYFIEVQNRINQKLLQAAY